MSNAEHSFRQAFDRLKSGKPELLPMGTAVSQNNVAKEAGCDPSAMRKSRYPKLISEIQTWIDSNEEDRAPSPRQATLAARKKNRTLRDRLEDIQIQRDSLASLLVEADTKIHELSMENARLLSQLNLSKVKNIK